jgi:hypothetical protein
MLKCWLSRKHFLWSKKKRGKQGDALGCMGTGGWMGWAGPVHPCDVRGPALSANLFVFMEDGSAWTSHHRSQLPVDLFDTSFQKKV